MRRFIVRGLLSASLLMLCAGAAFAWHVEGNVWCEGTGAPLQGISIHIQNQAGTPAFDQTTTSDGNGYYFFWLPESPGCYRLSANLTSSQTPVDPASGYYDFCTTESDFEFTRDFTVSDPSCGKKEGLCWLTGGGAKFSSITNTDLGQSKRPKTNKLYNWGGNINPGCSPTAGDGGQWNTIDDAQKLHFQGFHIEVVRCGNVDGIPPGSTSPVTPFNFIEWTGTGRVKGVQGNKADYPLVYFFGRCEDRNEPGSNGQRDGAGKDRYFLHVYTDPSNPNGSTIMLVDIDGDPSTVDPLIITDGNMQIHISSCDDVPDDFTLKASAPADDAMLSPSTPATSDEPASLWFAAPRPSPAVGNTTLRFSVPQASDVQLSVYDLMGREVAELMNGRAAAGIHTVGWDLRDGMGQPVSRGIYFLRLRVNGSVLNQRVTVMN
jgi:hypothetical protein